VVDEGHVPEEVSSPERGVAFHPADLSWPKVEKTLLSVVSAAAADRTPCTYRDLLCGETTARPP
jgi:hypothetical protein